MPPDRRTSTGRARLRWALSIAATVLLAVACGGSGGPPAQAGYPRRPPAAAAGRSGALTPPIATPPLAPAAPVTVRATVTTGVKRRLPRSFLGLSVEYWDVPALAAQPAALRRVLSLLRVPGDGHVLLRVGGDSADQSYWGRRATLRLGPWPYHVTGRWLHTLASVVRASHLRVLLDLNLAALSPRMASRFARAAVRHLPKGSVAGFEIGNEPDIYHHWIDYHLLGRAGQFVTPKGWDRYSARDYARAFGRYAAALARKAPRVPLAGPETAYPLHAMQWERDLLRSDPGRLGMVTVHRYPLTACTRPSAQDFASIAHMLSPRISAGLVPAVRPALRLAHRAGLPLRLDELNSATCEGRRGASNTFAAALWAPDALFALWKAGLDGANIHVRQGAANGAFSMSRAGVAARPLLYGLALFARAAGERGRLARLRVGQYVPSVRVWAVRRGTRLNVVVLDKGSHPANLMLRVPSQSPGLVERLSAPSIHATTGETLAGQTLGPNGRWVGPRVVQQLSPGPGPRYDLTVPAYSGVLISFRV